MYIYIYIIETSLTILTILLQYQSFRTEYFKIFNLHVKSMHAYMKLNVYY